MYYFYVNFTRSDARDAQRAWGANVVKKKNKKTRKEGGARIGNTELYRFAQAVVIRKLQDARITKLGARRDLARVNSRICDKRYQYLERW